MSGDVKHPTPNDPDNAWLWLVVALSAAIVASHYLV
jgi:hypothetical protein